MALSFARTPAGDQFAAELVRDRMAMAMYVPKHRAFVATVYPIEPMIATAAAHQMSKVLERTSTSKPAAIIAQTLQKMLSNNLVGRGARGEILTKLVCLLAYDHARNSSALDDADQCAPVTLEAFFDALSGSHATTQQLLRTKPLVGQDAPLSLWSQSTTVLAQWTKATGPAKFVDVNMALRAVLTQTAVECPPCTPAVDLFIVFTKDRDQPITASNLVVLFFQTKNADESRVVPLPDEKTVVDGFRQHGIPVIFVVHRVDMQREFALTDDQSVSTLPFAI